MLSISLVACNGNSGDNSQPIPSPTITPQPNPTITPPGPSGLTLNGKYVLSGSFGAITNKTIDNGLIQVADNSWKQIPLGAPVIFNYVFAKNRFVAVGGNNSADSYGNYKLFSDDGINWYLSSNERASNLGNLNIYYDSQNQKYLVPNRQSTDGITWTYFDNQDKIPMTYGNNRYLTIGNYGTYYSLNSASTWLTSNDNINMVGGIGRQVGLSFNDQKFIASNNSLSGIDYADPNTTQYAISTDGSNWTKQNYPIQINSSIYPYGLLSCTIRNLNNSYFCYFNLDNVNNASVTTSPDGINWNKITTLNLNGESQFNQTTVVYVNHKYYAYCGNKTSTQIIEDQGYRLCSSNDGINWIYYGNTPSPVTVNGSGYSLGNQGQTLTYQYGKYFLFGNFGKIWYSTDDMKTWSQTVSGISVSNYNTFQNSTSLSFVLGTTNSDYTTSALAIAYSTDNAASFKMANVPTIAQTPLAVATSGNDYVVVGTAGTLLHSSDGINWTQINVSNITTSDLTNVQYLNSKYYATGDLGFVLTSSDGINWSYSQASGYPRLMDIIYNNNKYFVVGYGGYIAYSSNGTNWIKATTPTSNQINSIAFGNNTYVAIGNSGTVLNSQNGVTWNAINASNLINYNINNIIYDSQDGFVAVGSNGLVMKSADGVNWIVDTPSNYTYGSITSLN